MFTRTGSPPSENQFVNPILPVRAGHGSRMVNRAPIRDSEGGQNGSQPQNNLLMQNYPQNKPKTSASTHRVSNQMASDPTEHGLVKAPIKMRVHNFDPFGVGFSSDNGSSPSNILSTRQTSQQHGLHFGQTATSNFYLNTMQPGQSLQQLLSSPQVNSTPSLQKGKVFVQNQQVIGLQQRTQQKLGSPSAGQIKLVNGVQPPMSKRQIFHTRKLIPAQQITPGLVPQQQPLKKDIGAYQTVQILDNKNGVFKQHPLNKNHLQNHPQPVLQQYPRGLSQNQNRRIIEDKNNKILGGLIQGKQQQLLVNYNVGGDLIEPDLESIQFNDTNQSPFYRHQAQEQLTEFNQVEQQIIKPYEIIVAQPSLMQTQPSTEHNMLVQQENKPRKNTQGLQGSIYSSSAASSLENEQNIIYLNDSESPQGFQIVRRQSSSEVGNQIQLMTNQQNAFFLKRKHNQLASSSVESTPMAQPDQYQFAQASSLNSQKKFASVKDVQHAAQGSPIIEQNQASKSKKHIIAKNHIKFANQQPSESGSEQQFKAKAILKIREAQQIADSFDKKGLDNAIVQYQFEMQDKEEENCFKDLLDTLNEFF